MKYQVPAKELKHTYSAKEIRPLLKEDRRPIKAIIGQERAVRALQFGLGNKAQGFNVYVSVYPGAGVMEAVEHYLEKLTPMEHSPQDYCYVNNFKDPYCPLKISLPNGAAREFKQDIRQLVEEAQKALLKAFESDEYAQKVEQVRKKYQKKESEIFRLIDKKAREQNFVIRRTPVEIIALPEVDGNPISDKQFFELPEEKRKELLKKQEKIQADLNNLGRRSREIQKEFAAELMDLQKRVALFAMENLLEELFEKYEEETDVTAYLEALKEDFLENLQQFLPGLEDSGDKPGPDNDLTRYEVNILVDNSGAEGAPVVVELHPTFHNLFGKIERESYMGTLLTNFSLIRGGALHRANGGYLVIPVEELFRNPFSWDGLKRALRNGQIVIEDVEERFGFISAKSLRPEPIPLDVQVILIGRPDHYFLLYQLDDDFKELFKVKAEFDTSMEASVENVGDFLGFVHRYTKEEGLRELAVDGMAALLEFSHRLTERQDRLTTRFGEVTNLVREANFYAGKDQAERVSGAHIERAIGEKHFRSNLLEEKIREYLDNGTILVNTEGKMAGQVNGLSVLDLGDISFGRPNRITATVAAGREGILDIEREARLGGKVHSKGVMILTGYLSGTFGKEKPLGLDARLVFEQSYSGVDGDSASSAELYALLSAISGLPVRQDIAVTGSVNQFGEIQAIGGVNEKVEGFFGLCRAKGLTGSQGVLIPGSNRRNLCLKQEVVDAVKAGDFFIWAIDHVDEGMEILLGRPAGREEKDEQTGAIAFTPGSVKDLVARRLAELLEILKEELQPEKTE